MKITGWVIDGFGVYCDEKRSKLAPGLNVFYGPNEAGKSTLLAFIRGVLFGFPTGRSNEQKYPPLSGGQHGGRVFLENSDGNYIVQREASGKRKLTLTLPNGQTGTEADLHELLGGADSALFRSIFAISLSELASLASLDREGIREHIFSTGVRGAGTSARAAINKLAAEGRKLLRPRSAAVINDLLKQLQPLEQQLEEARTRVQRYPALLEELSKLKEEKSNLEHDKTTQEKILREQEHYLQLKPIREKLLQVQEELRQCEHAKPSSAQQLSLLYIIVSTILGLGFLVSAVFFDSIIGTIIALLAATLGLGISYSLFSRRRAEETQNIAHQERIKTLQELQQTLIAQLTPSGCTPDSLSNILEKSSAQQRNEQRATREKLVSIERTLEQYVRDIHEIENSRDLLEASIEVPALEAEREALHSQLQQHIKRYQTVVVAQALIENTLSEFVRTRQPVVLAKASEIFVAVTESRYSRIVLEEDERTLAVIDQDGRKKEPDSLSRGTAELLYICLRLALAEDFARRGQSLPLIMDDVLVNLDPRRAESMARILADYAENHQVHIFTCHPLTVEMFRTTERAAIHQLGETTGYARMDLEQPNRGLY